MTEKRACPECGVTLSPNAPRGLCPRCLMGAAFSSTAPFKPSPDPAGSRVPTTGTTVDFAEFQRAALEIGLIDAEELEGYALGGSGEVPRLARALVRSGKLTAYQANALAQGKAKGLVIGSYLVLEKRGQGGMGVVFKAKHRQTDKLVALKILLPSFGRDREAVLRFRREFEIAARLSHPNVVAALEASEDRNVQFLTMEFVEGNDLDVIVREVGPLPIKMSLHCALQAARGLAAAHAQGIIHRDVKPGNLMLDPSGDVRVLDLGLARVIEAANPIGRAAGQALTQTGTYMGTVDFIAPEQADDSKNADHKADIYSLGCTLYFLLTGRPPFEGETILKRLMAHQQKPAPSLHAARDDVPAALEAAYQTMMAKRPADRPRSMAEVIDLLEACRTSADEAKEARSDLKTFAQTFMKRASPRKRDRSPDASVFARRTESGRFQFDPDLNLEDLVMDYREEIKPRQLTEDQLPPMMPRIKAAPRRRRRSPVGPGLGLVALLGLCVAAYALFPRKAPEPTPLVPMSSPVIAGPAVASGGFTPLFNGKDLNGWAGDIDGYDVRDGAVVNKSGRRAAIYYPTIYRDFAARVEFRLSPGGDSGLMIRYPGEGLSSGTGMCEIQILDETVPRAEKDPRHGHGSALGIVAAKKGPLRPPGQWNSQEVTVRGSTIKVELNGVVILNTDLAPVREFMDNMPHPGKDRKEGYFGLTGFWYPVEYRKVEIKDLTPDNPPSRTAPKPENWVSLFNGRDLNGWAGDVGDYEVRDGVVSCKPGKGAAIYYPTIYRDFAARVEFRLSPGGNSGLAIRYPGQGNPAYEGMCEIEINDASSPKYAGMDPRVSHGSALGMVAAKQGALRPPGQWNTQEVTVRGSTIRVELNGVVILEADLGQVREFQDNIPHPGKDRKGGYFGLVDWQFPVDFRKVEIRELGPAPPAPRTASRPETWASPWSTTGRIIRPAPGRGSTGPSPRSARSPRTTTWKSAGSGPRPPRSSACRRRAPAGRIGRDRRSPGTIPGPTDERVAHPGRAALLARQ